MSIRSVPFPDGTWTPNPNPPRQNSTFAELIKGRESEYPTLARSIREMIPARSVKIEWLTPKGSALSNFCQIVRFPYTGEPVEEGSSQKGWHYAPEEATTGLLTGVENILENGRPTLVLGPRGAWYRTCGGYRYYLGRDLIDADKLVLRPLRQPRLTVWKYLTTKPYDSEEWDGSYEELERPRYEWLTEFSLQVVPGDV